MQELSLTISVLCPCKLLTLVSMTVSSKMSFVQWLLDLLGLMLTNFFTTFCGRPLIAGQAARVNHNRKPNAGLIMDERTLIYVLNNAEHLRLCRQQIKEFQDLLQRYRNTPNMVHENIELRESPGQGLGYFATDKIPKGTVLIMEDALLADTNQLLLNPDAPLPDEPGMSGVWFLMQAYLCLLPEDAEKFQCLLDLTQNEDLLRQMDQKEVKAMLLHLKLNRGVYARLPEEIRKKLYTITRVMLITTDDVEKDEELSVCYNDPASQDTSHGDMLDKQNTTRQ